MAGAKLSPESKAEFARRLAATRAAKAREKAGEGTSQSGTRTWEQIKADIEAITGRPVVVPGETPAQGTQPNHHVTDSNNHTRPIMGKGRGSMGAGMGGAANVQFGEQIK